MSKEKFYKLFSLIVNHPNTTLFDVFEKVFLKAYWELVPNRGTNFKTIKKDRDRRQRTDDLSPILPDSHGQPGYFVVFLFCGAARPTTSADLYSHSQKTFPISVI